MTCAVRLPMRGRAADEEHRAASQLELLFDLTFVVAASALTHQLARAVAAGDVGATIVPFLQVFFAIWWAWMNFTWFASSYDTDDVAYRLLTLVQMAGVLVLASGVAPAIEHGELLGVTLGYLIMRVGLVAQWLRAWREDRARRHTALRYAAGISVAEVLWLLRQAFADSLPTASLLPIFVGLVGLELAVPWWAEQRTPTTWHPRHIAERYGLFAILLLGEGIFAASAAIDEVVERSGVTGSSVAIAAGGLFLVFSLWWLYFAHPAGEGLAAHREGSFRWGYGHYGVFASLVGLGAGLEVAIEQTGHHIAASDLVVSSAVAVPVAIFLTLVWVVHQPIVDRPACHPAAMLAGAGVCVLLPLLVPVVGVAGVVVGLAVVAGVLVAIALVSQVGSLHGL